MKALSFKAEAAKHLANLSQIRSASDCKLVEELKIECAASDTFVVIPCHLKEKGLIESLAAYANAGVTKDFQFIVFLNADLTTSRAEFKKFLKLRLQDWERVQDQYPEMQIQCFSHHFREPVIISRIRGIVTDALILSCFEQDVHDPILISNDADALSYSTNYLQLIRRAFRESPVDFVSGNIYWTGSDSEGQIRYQPPVPLPELYLNEVFAQSGDKVYREFGSIYTTGCNSAFRLSAVAAVGGYDYDFAPFYDVEIGNALKEFRDREAEAVESTQFAEIDSVDENIDSENASSVNTNSVNTESENLDSSDFASETKSCIFLEDCILTNIARQASHFRAGKDSARRQSLP